LAATAGFRPRILEEDALSDKALMSRGSLMVRLVLGDPGRLGACEGGVPTT
jgi:hypothetical protein